MRLFMLSLAFLLAACATQPSNYDTASSLPSTASIERPEDPEAAQMVDHFLSIMDARMKLAEDIGRLETRDQYVREVFIGMFRNPELDPDVRSAFQESGGVYVDLIDEINTQELRDVLGNITWRELAEYENNLFKRAFHIVQHSNDEQYRADVLEEIQPLAEEGLIEGQQFALMFDRVELQKNQTQLYGTQTKCIDGVLDTPGLLNPEDVDERRAQMGMRPLSEYLETNRQLYGPCSNKQ